VKLPDGWRAALDLFCVFAVPFDDSCFRSVELAWAHPDDVISGEGTRLKGGRPIRDDVSVSRNFPPHR
jgi:hypothetical protein